MQRQRSRRRSPSRSGQGGFTIIEMLIASTLLAIGLSAGLWAARQEALADAFKAQGETLKAIGNAGGNEYILRYYSELQKAAPSIPGVVDPYRPTMAELKAIGLPIQNFADTGWTNLPYRFRFQRVPAGCTPPACDVTGLVYLAGPLRDPATGGVYGRGLGEAITAIGGDGGFSDDLSPGTISGFGGQWNQPNPMGSQVGTLAMQVGYATLGWQQFLRRDGSLPMMGTLNMRDAAGTRHNIANVNALDAQSATLPGASNANSLRVGNTYFYGDGLNSAVRTPAGGGFHVQDVNGNAADIKSARDIYTRDVYANTTQANESYVNGWFRARNDAGLYWEKWGGGWYMGDPDWIRAYNGKGIWTSGQVQADGSVTSGYISSWGRVRSGEYMQIDGVANENWGCSPNGLVGRDGPGALLSCQNGIWKKLGGGEPPPGSLCGVQWNTGRPTVACMGISWVTGPMACPGGWVRTEVLVEGGNRMNMCVKS
uniref:shufflon system plasmid conjugative transfer pilus tip adhesin PilV n=1 Tax=Cupriavidus gilardii TaxID=82541 RepID=UPI002479B794|nr:shufflon system plasmid conjugative transfer pilus tip adhesin PilV [Cupriavidus gilardii]WDE72522.1 hypothetical protein [Cupriavidus gilardii]